MAIKYANIFHCNLQDPPKFTQIAIVGPKIYHLATQTHLPVGNNKELSNLSLNLIELKALE
jgi:hypothetical protein